jgi:hypothetical protein
VTVDAPGSPTEDSGMVRSKTPATQFQESAMTTAREIMTGGANASVKTKRSKQQPAR